jgi:DNA (cytosine-5)-methyltransferase 1
MRAKGNGFGVRIVTEFDEYTPTISARYYKDGSDCIMKLQYMGPSNSYYYRKLTPRECARLQGYPDNFVIPVSDTQAYKQFGNSVAVPVIKAIAEEILKGVKEAQQEMK